ncbi:glycosyltransferase family 2 protein [Gangjinia marincola]|uniref:Glycosyltransferase family 2 protein n=1 Tax=Gangjinia marincola TaxID=578463 RepID=A0ABP3XXC3_9FLAO
MIDICAIIINYNTASYTIGCINSLLENTSTQTSYELVIVDNNSSFEDYSTLKKHIGTVNDYRVKLVRSKQNIGFGAGNMLGVQHTSPCKYYAFINNDTLMVSKDCLGGLKLFMQQTPDAGICSPQMLDEDKNFRVTIDHYSSLKREIFRRPLLERLFPTTYLNRKQRFEQPTVVHYVQGSFMFVDAASFNMIGGFDTNLFLFYEESDLSLRMTKKSNKNTYIVPSLEYIHYKSASMNKNIYLKMEQKISLLYHTQKHYGSIQRAVLNSYFCIRYFFTALIKPSYWRLFVLLLEGAPLSKSLKLKQQINEEI